MPGAWSGLKALIVCSEEVANSSVCLIKWLGQSYGVNIAPQNVVGLDNVDGWFMETKAV